MSPRPSADLEIEVRSLLQRVEKLERAIFPKNKKKHGSGRASLAAKSLASVTLDFSMPIRAFMKKHANRLSGPRKFVLLVAYLTKGDLNKRVSMIEVKKRWSRLTSLLGGEFNGAHSSRARENDWVNTEKAGLYHLRPGWKAILS